MAVVPDWNGSESELECSESEPEVEAGVKDETAEAPKATGDENHVVMAEGELGSEESEESEEAKGSECTWCDKCGLLFGSPEILEMHEDLLCDGYKVIIREGGF